MRNPSRLSPIGPLLLVFSFSLGLHPQTLPACQTSELTIAVTSYGDRRGHDSYVFDLTNLGQRTCTLFGYPSVVALNGKGKIVREIQFQHSPPTVASEDQKPETIRLAHGEHAWFEIGGSHPVGGTDRSSCEKATEVRITPPQNKKPLREHYPWESCRPDVSLSFLVTGSAKE